MCNVLGRACPDVGCTIDRDITLYARSKCGVDVRKNGVVVLTDVEERTRTVPSFNETRKSLLTLGELS